jgi:hypothetical protein
MFERFNFYDFYGYFVPGGFFWMCVAPLAYAIWTLVAGTAPPVGNLGLGESVILLFVAYVTGHVLQTLARFYRILDDKNRDLGTSLLRIGRTPGSDRSIFSDSLRGAIHDAIAARLGIAKVDHSNVDEETCRERFQLAYSHVIVTKSASYVEIYNGLYALYRGLYCVALLCGQVTKVVLIVWLLYHILAVTLRHLWPLGVQLVSLGVLFTAMIGFQLMLEPLRQRFQEFSNNFARAVCQEMLTLAGSGKAAEATARA